MQKWVHLTLADGKTIDATEGHPFNTPDGWRDAILLKKGGQVILKGENGEAKSIEIADVRVAERRLTTYNLEVANAHTFFVGEDAVLVHNCGPGRAGKQKRLRELMNDDKVSSADRGWIKQEINSIDRGDRKNIRNPPGKDMAHERGREAAKGYGYEHSNLQDRDLHRLQHRYDNYGRNNKERPVK